MSASMEYLLCGLPVVSTPSIGGRDIFFESDFSRIVAPDEEAISSAVSELIGARISPVQVRQRVLSQLEVHRRRFISLVQSVYDQAGCRRSFSDEWGTFLADTRWAAHTVEEILRMSSP